MKYLNSFLQLNENVSQANAILAKLNVPKTDDKFKKIIEFTNRDGYMGIVTKAVYEFGLDMEKAKEFHKLLKAKKIDLGKQDIKNLKTKEDVIKFMDILSAPEPKKDDYELLFEVNNFLVYRVNTYKGILEIGSPAWCLKTKSHWQSYRKQHKSNGQTIQFVVIHKNFVIDDVSLLSVPDNYESSEKYKTSLPKMRFGITLYPDDESICIHDDNNQGIKDIDTKFNKFLLQILYKIIEYGKNIKTDDIEFVKKYVTNFAGVAGDAEEEEYGEEADEEYEVEADEDEEDEQEAGNVYDERTHQYRARTPMDTIRRNNSTPPREIPEYTAYKTRVFGHIRDWNRERPEDVDNLEELLNGRFRSILISLYNDDVDEEEAASDILEDGDIRNALENFEEPDEEDEEMTINQINDELENEERNNWFSSLLAARATVRNNPGQPATDRDIVDEEDEEDEDEGDDEEEQSETLAYIFNGRIGRLESELNDYEEDLERVEIRMADAEDEGNELDEETENRFDRIKNNITSTVSKIRRELSGKITKTLDAIREIEEELMEYDDEEEDDPIVQEMIRNKDKLEKALRKMETKKEEYDNYNNRE